MEDRVSYTRLELRLAFGLGILFGTVVTALTLYH
jgi:hypothetical protein